jgi:hypothetical protein
MAGKSTIKMIRAYFEQAPAPMFLSSFFTLKADGIHESEYVEIDIQRDGEELAPVLKDCTGYNVNDDSVYSNKEFKPPVFGEEAQFEACNLIDREPGENPYESKGFMRKAMQKVRRALNKLMPKIRRSIELQSATILQTGVCSLLGKDGTVQYTLDFQPKASHFPTVAVAWTGGAGTPLQDINNLAKLNRRDGKFTSDTLIFGTAAWAGITQNAAFKEALESRRGVTASVRPESVPEDATWQGTIWIENYEYNMYTYDGFYKDPASGNPVDYVFPESCIVMSSRARLDATFGGVPLFRPPQSIALRFVPRQFASLASMMNALVNAWISPNGETLSVGVKARPLMIPVAIDSFGCLDTGTNP